MIIQLSSYQWLELVTMTPIMDSAKHGTPTMYVGRGDIDQCESYTGQARVSLLRFLNDTANKRYFVDSPTT